MGMVLSTSSAGISRLEVDTHRRRRGHLPQDAEVVLRRRDTERLRVAARRRVDILDVGELEREVDALVLVEVDFRPVEVDP